MLVWVLSKDSAMAYTFLKGNTISSQNWTKPSLLTSDWIDVWNCQQLKEEDWAQSRVTKEMPFQDMKRSNVCFNLILQQRLLRYIRMGYYRQGITLNSGSVSEI